MEKHENLEKIDKLKALKTERREHFDRMYEDDTKWIDELIIQLGGAVKNTSSLVQQKTKKTNKSSKNATFMTKVEQILKEADKPLTINEMIEEFNKTSDVEYKYPRFSGTLSAQYKKDRSKIEMEKVSDFPLTFRYLYTLNECY